MTLVGIIAWIVLGLVAGIIAKLIMPGPDPGGFIVTTLIGIVGAFVGGWLGQTLFGVGEAAFSWAGLLTAIIGAIILLVIYRLVTGRGSTRGSRT